jgi:hypothetical protein
MFGMRSEDARLRAIVESVVRKEQEECLKRLISVESSLQEIKETLDEEFGDED